MGWVFATCRPRLLTFKTYRFYVTFLGPLIPEVSSRNRNRTEQHCCRVANVLDPISCYSAALSDTLLGIVNFLLIIINQC